MRQGGVLVSNDAYVLFRGGRIRWVLADYLTLVSLTCSGTRHLRRNDLASTELRFIRLLYCDINVIERCISLVTRVEYSFLNNLLQFLKLLHP